VLWTGYAAVGSF
jgi:hypothetical protein